jgi:hypothetical protein
VTGELFSVVRVILGSYSISYELWERYRALGYRLGRSTFGDVFLEEDVMESLLLTFNTMFYMYIRMVFSLSYSIIR